LLFSDNGSNSGAAREEAFLMDIIASNNGSNNLVNEQDQQEADSYLNMSGDAIDAEEQPIVETRNDGKPSKV
jgi:hypothetical protein